MNTEGQQFKSGASVKENSEKTTELSGVYIYGHARRMKEEHIVRRMLDVDVIILCS